MAVHGCRNRAGGANGKRLRLYVLALRRHDSTCEQAQAAARGGTRRSVEGRRRGRGFTPERGGTGQRRSGRRRRRRGARHAEPATTSARSAVPRRTSSVAALRPATSPSWPRSRSAPSSASRTRRPVPAPRPPSPANRRPPKNGREAPSSRHARRSTWWSVTNRAPAPVPIARPTPNRTRRPKRLLPRDSVARCECESVWNSGSSPSVWPTVHSSGVDSAAVTNPFRPLTGLAAVAFATMACEVGSCGPPHPAQVPAPVASSAAPIASAAPSGSTSAGVAAFDLGSVVALTQHPALVDVRTALGSKDPRAAADALSIVVKEKKLAGKDLDRARFLLGRLLQQAKDEEGAINVYAAVSADYPLEPHASLRRATMLAKKGKSDDALALLSHVPATAPFSVDRHFVTGDALAAKGDHAGAADAYAAEKKGPRAFEAIIRWAEEVAAASKTADAFEAAKAVRRVRFERPASVLAPRAEDAENKCKALLPAAEQATFGAPSAAEQAIAAQAWLDAGKPKDALPLATKVVAGEKKGSDSWCRAATTVARAHERLRERAKASDAYGELIAGCTDETRPRLGPLRRGEGRALRQAARPRAHPVCDAREGLPQAPTRRRRASPRRSGGHRCGRRRQGRGDARGAPRRLRRGRHAHRGAVPPRAAAHEEGRLGRRDPLPREVARLAPREDGYFVAGRALYFLGRAKIETGAVGRRRREATRGRSRASRSPSPRRWPTPASPPRSKEDAEAARKAIEHGIAFEPTGTAVRPRARRGLDGGVHARCRARARRRERFRAQGARRRRPARRRDQGSGARQWLVAAIFASVADAKAAHWVPPRSPRRLEPPLPRRKVAHGVGDRVPACVRRVSSRPRQPPRACRRRWCGP